MGTASLETWSEPITEIKQEFQMSLDYPDIYMCLPDVFVEAYSGEGGANAYYSWAGFSAASYEAFANDEACDLTEHRGSFIKVDPLSMRPFGGDTSRASYVAADDPGSCPVMKPTHGGRSADAPADTGANMAIGCPSHADRDECGNWAASISQDADSTKLMSLIPRQEPSAGAYEPLCIKYGMKPGSKQYYDERRKYFLAMQQETDVVDVNGPYWVTYLAEAGTAPYHCNSTEKDGNERCAINATAIYFPGMPSISIAMLSIEYVKDLRADPDAAFVPIYKYNMWNKMQINHLGGGIELTRGIMGFQYGAPRHTMPSIVRYRSNVEAGLTTIVYAFERQRISSRALSRYATSVRARYWPRSAVCGPLQRPLSPSFGPTAAISTGRGAVK